MSGVLTSTAWRRGALVWLGGLAALQAAACGGSDYCDPDAPGTICTIAGNGKVRTTGGQPPHDAREASFSVPMDVAIHPDTGEPWVIDFNAYYVRAIDADYQIRTVVGAGPEALGDSPRADDGPSVPALAAGLNHFPDMAFHDGYLYLAAWHNSRIKRVRLDTMELENFAGAARRVHYSGDGGPAMEASLDLPSAIAIEPRSGEIYVMDQANQVIRTIDEDGIIDRFAGNCVIDAAVTAIDALACERGEQPAACPSGLDEGKTLCAPPRVQGEVALGLTLEPAVERDWSYCALECSPGFAGEGVHCLDIRIAMGAGQDTDPNGRMAFDADGNLFFADTDNHVVRRIDADGIVTTLAGTAPDADGKHGGFAGDGGPATEALLERPIDVEVASDGTVYFTDMGNHCVRKVEPGGTIETVAGLCGPRGLGQPSFAGDGGDPREALLYWPYGIELDERAGKLYVADSYNYRVRVVNL